MWTVRGFDLRLGLVWVTVIDRFWPVLVARVWPVVTPYPPSASWLFPRLCPLGLDRRDRR